LNSASRVVIAWENPARVTTGVTPLDALKVRVPSLKNTNIF